jgi:hypothetical protein
MPIVLRKILLRRDEKSIGPDFPEEEECGPTGQRDKSQMPRFTKIAKRAETLPQFLTFFSR